jgi:hypothetical protein
MRWESWLPRLGLAALAALHAIGGNPQGALVAVQGFLVALLPRLVERLSSLRVPRPVEALFVLGTALQFGSESLKLFELLTYWDKIVHPTLVALTSWLTVWLLLSFSDEFQKRLPVHLVAAIGLLLGMGLGAAWEFVELMSDWFGAADLQKSNADTMTDLISNDSGAFVATLLSLRLYRVWLSDRQRSEAGRLALWLASGPARGLDRHGGLIGALLAVGLAATIGAAQAIDQGARPVLADGISPGPSMTWGGLDEPTAVLAGEWIQDQRGTCRINVDNPKPGSETDGLLQIAPDTVYGLNNQEFVLETRLMEERPDRSAGTQMDGGLAFGIRDKDNFYLLELSVLHDVLRLNHIVNGRRRDIREEMVRTRANEWHTLQVRVGNGRVEAAIDGRRRLAVDDAPATEGGIGLWARVAAATCFQGARVEGG